MMPSRSRTPLILGLALALVAFAATAALAGGLQRVASKVRLANADPFHGKVVSEKRACERNRTVKVYKSNYTMPDGLYGSTTTDADGKWSIPATPNGKFYAVVTKKETAKFLCRADVSPTKSFSST
jgi:hypothetical protein